MTAPLKYPRPRYFRFSHETDAELVKLAKKAKLKPAVVGRMLVEYALRSEVIKKKVVGQ